MGGEKKRRKRITFSAMNQVMRRGRDFLLACESGQTLSFRAQRLTFFLLDPSPYIHGLADEKCQSDLDALPSPSPRSQPSSKR